MEGIGRRGSKMEGKLRELGGERVKWGVKGN